MFLLYDLIFIIYAIFYLPYLLLTKRGYPGYAMRFGLFSTLTTKQIISRPNVWLHAVSVGEVMVIDGFMDKLSAAYPNYQLVVTVTTKTGYELALKNLNGKALVIPSPLDVSFTAKRFVKLINPRMYIAAETEIWPNLYRQLYRQHVPMAVINGRISDKSFGRYKFIRFLLKGILNQVSVWCMQSQRDAQRILDLGADPSRVVVAGNIKFDDLPGSAAAFGGNFTVRPGEQWWVAGSTHPGEEEMVLDVYAEIIKKDPQWRLVIVPRHIERTGKILELVKCRGFAAVKFSELKDVNPHQGVIVVDTIGQLRSLYALASLVFVGKSLCVGGGHNVIEPALYGKAVIIGPKVENFRDIVACFKENNALVQVEDEPSLLAAVSDLVADRSKREALGQRAQEVIAVNQGATKRSLERLEEFLK